MSNLKAKTGSAKVATLSQQLPAKQATKAKLGAGKMMPVEQRRRFIEAARGAGASNDEANSDVALKRLAKPKKLSS